MNRETLRGRLPEEAEPWILSSGVSSADGSR